MNGTTLTLLMGLACALDGSSNTVDGLLPPVRLTAAGEIIDVGDCIAHAGPNLFDLDGDGKQDLLVGDFVGHMHFYRNTGTNAVPAYADGQKLEANGEVIKIPNW